MGTRDILSKRDKQELQKTLNFNDEQFNQWLDDVEKAQWQSAMSRGTTVTLRDPKSGDSVKAIIVDQALEKTIREEFAESGTSEKLSKSIDHITRNIRQSHFARTLCKALVPKKNRKVLMYKSQTADLQKSLEPKKPKKREPFMKGDTVLIKGQVVGRITAIGRDGYTCRNVMTNEKYQVLKTDKIEKAMIV